MDERDHRKLVLASDHAGFELKEAIKAELLRQGRNVEDRGTHSPQAGQLGRIRGAGGGAG